MSLVFLGTRWRANTIKRYLLKWGSHKQGASLLLGPSPHITLSSQNLSCWYYYPYLQMSSRLWLHVTDWIHTCLSETGCLSVHVTEKLGTLKPASLYFSYLWFPPLAKSSHSLQWQMSSQEWRHGCAQLRCMSQRLCSQRGKDFSFLPTPHSKILERESIGQQRSRAQLLPISMGRKSGTVIGSDWVSCPLLWTKMICFQKKSRKRLR